MKMINNDVEVPSTQFLFDKFKSGRAKYIIGESMPEIEWSFNVRSFPPKAPESAPAFDRKKNLYFGCHDGCIYSITKNGNFRWSYKTDKKIYSSPIITENDEVIIIGGDGYAYKFSSNGELLWIYDTSYNYRKKTKHMVLNRILTLNKTFDYGRKQFWTMRSWSSPSLSSEGTLYLTGYGIGLHAVDIDSGKLKWKYDLGSPRFHLSGVAIDKQERVYVCSQQSYVHCLDNEGSLIWKVKLKDNYDLWGNPNIDPDSGILYVSASYMESKAVVYAINSDGNILWKKSLSGGIRGSISISYENYIVVGTFNGIIYFLDKKNGDIIFEKKYSNAIRALWTTPTIDKNGNILFTTKESMYEGSLVCLEKNGETKWILSEIGKSLSVPIIDENGKVYIGTWKGKMLCINTF